MQSNYLFILIDSSFYAKTERARYGRDGVTGVLVYIVSDASVEWGNNSCRPGAGFVQVTVVKVLVCDCT